MVEEKGKDPPPLPRPRRRWLRAVLLGGLIFVCGIILGGGLMLGILWVNLLRSIQHPEELPTRATKRLSRTLDLTREQKKKVREIIEERLEAIQEIQREVRPRVEDELDKLDKEIEVILTPKQAKRWNRLFETMRKRWRPPLPPATGPPPATP